MDIEKRLRPDLWKAIEAHYERADFTEAVRDAVFHINELLREKSGYADKDGNKLVEAALMGSNPAISVSKNDTTTERDFQQGIAFALKGIMSAVRNPLSHEKMIYTKEDSEAIILYVNYLLNQIDNSGGFSKIDNIMELLYDEDFTTDKEYAELLLKEVPVKKRYDLLVELFHDRENLRQGKLHYFIEGLFDSLTKASKSSFIRLLNSELMICKDDYRLRMYIHYFMKLTYKDLDRLVQLRIEAFLLKAIRAGKVVGENCVDEGSLATWIDDIELVKLLGNTDEILNALINKFSGDETEKLFVFTYFSDFVYENLKKLSDLQKYIIRKCLYQGDERLYNFLFNEIELIRDKVLCEMFGEAFEKCSKVLQGLEPPGEPCPF